MNLLKWLRGGMQPKVREYSVFISYSRQDNHIVSPLMQIVRLGGTGVFRDMEHIPPGTRWRTVVTDAVDMCQLMLLFWCRHSAHSDEVKHEYCRALQGGKLVSPVLLDDTPLTTQLSDHQAIDLRELSIHAKAEPSLTGQYNGGWVLHEADNAMKRLARGCDASGSKHHATTITPAVLSKIEERMLTGLGNQLGILESKR